MSSTDVRAPSRVPKFNFLQTSKQKSCLRDCTCFSLATVALGWGKNVNPTSVDVRWRNCGARKYLGYTSLAFVCVLAIWSTLNSRALAH